MATLGYGANTWVLDILFVGAIVSMVFGFIRFIYKRVTGQTEESLTGLHTVVICNRDVWGIHVDGFDYLSAKVSYDGGKGTWQLLGIHTFGDEIHDVWDSLSDSGKEYVRQMIEIKVTSMRATVV